MNPYKRTDMVNFANSILSGWGDAMAEKRALSRVILKTTGFYKFGVFGEDESDDFKEKVA